MKVKTLALFLAVACCLATPTLNAQNTHAAGAQNANAAVHEPLMLGIHWAKGVVNQSSSNPLMTWHNGDILASTVAGAIFWGPNWSNATFEADKVTGLDRFYSDIGGSNYAATCDEYTGLNNTQVGSGITYIGHFFDYSATSTNAPKTSTIVNKACSVLTANKVTPVSSGYYVVYSDQPRKVSYCGWHSYGTCNGTNIQVAFVFNLDGDAGCDPQDTQTGNSQGLAALANVSAHEISEARTDPRNGGWYDGSGQENGDKCAWTFNVPYVSFNGLSIWKVQGEWSNAAYSAGTGYPNRSGQNGCLSGQ